MATLSGIFQFLRRHTGAIGAPTTLKSGQPFVNEVENVLYMGVGDDGTGASTAQIAMGGKGAFLDLLSAQTVGGAKTFSVAPSVPAATAAAHALGRGQMYSEISDIRQFAPAGNPFASGGDDTATWQAALTWLLTGTNHRALRVPAGASTCSQTLTGNIAGSKHIAILTDGRHDIVYPDGVNGWALTRDYSAGIAIPTHFGLYRTVSSGSTDEAGIAFSLKINTNSPTSGKSGRIVLSGLVMASTGQDGAFGWFGGCYVESPVNAQLGGMQFNGRNGKGILEDYTVTSQSNYNPSTYSFLLWICGASSTYYALDTRINYIKGQGAHVGVRVSGYFQGIHVLNSPIIGNDYGVHGYGPTGAAPELLEVSGCTFNATQSSIYGENIGTPMFGTNQHLRFNPSSAPWACMHLHNCNGYYVGPQVGVGGSGSGGSNEKGFWDSSTVAAGPGSSNGVVLGWAVELIAGPWVQLDAAVTNKVVIAGSTNGSGTQVVANSKMNMVFANGVNGSLDFTSDGVGNTYFLGSNLFANVILPSTTSAQIGAGGANTFNQTWTKQVLNSAGPITFFTPSGLWPASDQQSNLGDPTARWTSGYFGQQIVVGTNKVVGPRQTGWTAMSGTADTSASLATSTVTLVQLAQRVKSIEDALITHGLIGT